jgi:amino-acid N-acetyltransferase
MNASIERATESDLDRVLALLGEVDLPVEGVIEHFEEFLVARDGDELIGCAGLERHGEAALLRSLAVSPARRGGGLGKALTSRLLDEARGSGAKDVVLLTTTAADFFALQFGFAEVDRNRFDEIFASSEEWRLPRCSSAVCMRLTLSR